MINLCVCAESLFTDLSDGKIEFYCIGRVCLWSSRIFEMLEAKFVPGTSIIIPSIYGILLSCIAGKLHDKRQMNGWKAVSVPVSVYSNSWGLIEWHVLMDDHKEAEAISKLSKAISFKPDLQLLHLCAAFHDSMGDYISTRCDCEVALCLDPSHTDTIELYHRA
ncbi:hypothetical protein RHSIM_Rhsim05G0205000 [Rhododendron simsii]|uniref:Uncharacterized protein n=1 Tax=Rhododendron simsii TaxID=118357 RepID=A0A834GXM2_RHOSS|nr:hypothetical protein RHSIM_Rhsim05G0205000 [Rhododendron simsii]